MDDHGIWTFEEACQAHRYSLELADNLAKIFRRDLPILDLGCGVGFYANHLSQKAFSVLAFEGTPGIESIALFKPIYTHDLTQSSLSLPRGQILCLEVGEHIPAQFEGHLLDTLAALTVGTLVLSWAIPGQGGLGHVNERLNDYIIDRMQERGLIFSPDTTAFLRSAVGTCWWFAQTLLVFTTPSIPA